MINTSIYRCLSTVVSTATNKKSSATSLSSLVKQLSKFSSHDKLIEYSQQPIDYCYPNRMIQACSPMTTTAPSIDLVDVASNLHRQLLVRIAHYLACFQSIPFLPGVNPTLLALHERYLKLFDSFIMFPTVRTTDDEKKFADLVQHFVMQNNDVIGLLSTGCSEAQKYFKSYGTMEDFLDNVLRSRLSMRLLAEHYLELHKQQRDRHLSTNNSNDRWIGAICANFSPRKAIQQCIDDVTSICFETYSVAPHVEIEDNLNETFPYFPSIVEYIVRELLKNSMRALVESNKLALGNIHRVKQYFHDHRNQPLCKVMITSDPIDQHFTIAISDQGGGINDANEHIFRYMFSGRIADEH
jgi:[3-methyl-2-oxobutanoate dehydrogenase (acetyl-transferring)] kinase